MSIDTHEIAKVLHGLLRDYEQTVSELTDGEYGHPNTPAYARARGLLSKLILAAKTTDRGPSAETLARECRAAVEQTGNIPRRESQ